MKLTHSRLLEVLSYDRSTGIFRWKVSLAPRGRVGAVAGAKSAAGRGRIEIRIDGELWLGHRLAWFYVNGTPPDGMLDHIDGNPSNNIFGNLRPATLTENNRNRAKLAGRTSEWKGVSWNKGKKRWCASLMKAGKHVFREYFRDEREAAEAYIFAALEHHGEFVRAH